MAANEQIKKIQSIVDSADCLYDFNQLNQALDKMADAITTKIQHEHPIILCVMTGAMIPMSHLVTRLNFPLEIDYIHATRYRGKMTGGELHWLAEPRYDLANRTILIVDDIMDGGLTLNGIINYCEMKNAKKIYSAVMVDKKRTRELGVNFEPDFVGVETEDRFLFGFGLDYEEQCRNLPGIYAVNF